MMENLVLQYFFETKQVAGHLEKMLTEALEKNSSTIVCCPGYFNSDFIVDAMTETLNTKGLVFHKMEYDLAGEFMLPDIAIRDALNEAYETGIAKDGVDIIKQLIEFAEIDMLLLKVRAVEKSEKGTMVIVVCRKTSSFVRLDGYGVFLMN